MLVYLDTWLWSRLSRARSQEPEAFHTFRQTWGDLGCVLAVSRTHLYELRRHGDPEEREARYRLVEDLLPGCFDMLSTEKPFLKSVTNREIAVSFAREFKPDILERIDRYWAGFPLPIRDKDDVAVFRQIEEPMVGTALSLLRTLLTADASERKRPKGTQYQRVRLTSIPTEKLPRSQVEPWMKMIEAQTTKAALWQQASTLFSDEQIAEEIAKTTETIRRVLIRATQVGRRKALTEHYAAPRVREKEYTDKVIQQSTFRSSVEEVVRGFWGLNYPTALEAAMDLMTIDRCPGTWLRDNVEIELRKSKAEPEPNDWFDLDHLTHLPYVDVFVSDAELVNNTLKVLRRVDALPASLQGVNLPLNVDGSLDSIVETIRRAAR